MPLKPHFPPVYSPFANDRQAQPGIAQRKVAPVAKPAAAVIAVTAAPKPSPLQPKMRPSAPVKPGFRPVTVQRKQIGNSVIQRAFGKPTGAPNPGKLEYNSSTDATTGMMVLYRGHDLLLVCERTFASGGGHHAEEKAILYLQNQVNLGNLTPQHTGAKDYILYLAVSKSPCSSTSMPATRTDGNPGCLELLANLNANGLVHAGTLNTVTFDVQISATKPYQPKIQGGKAASTGSYGGFGGGASGGGTFGWVR
jgi:hypothetical protein